MKMKLSREKQQHLLLVGMVTLIVVLGLYFMVIKDQSEKLQKGEKRISDTTDKVNRAKGVLKSELAIMSDLNTATNELMTLEAGMASGNDKYLWFINTLNRFKVPYANQVDIPNVSRERVTEIGTFANFPYKAAIFSLRGTAHFHSFGRFLADFENKFPYFRIQKLALTPTGSDLSPDGSEKIAFDMDVVTLINPNTP
jgi:hypothetical protein